MKMSGALLCFVLIICLLPTESYIPVSDTARRSSLNRLVGQQPLLFGRRGINPNMNSLFFGKRLSSGSQPGPSLRGLLLSSYDHMMPGPENVS